MTAQDKSLESKVDVLEERIANLIKSAEEHHSCVSKKMDAMQSTLNQLPCTSSKRKMDGLQNQINWLWGLLVVLLVAMIGALVK